jgi:hypothetical protein
MDVSLDITDSTTDGSTGGYISNRIVRNNLGPAGGQVLYKSGTVYPGGLTAGLAQQSCTPAVTGSTCTWTYANNVLGLGQWAHQTNNTPFPSSNQTCNGAGATCFPTGTAFTSLFVNYNSAAGQTGYLGDYHLSAGSPYAGAGTDGKDIGANINQVLALTAGVRSNTIYAAAGIITTSLPNATVGTAYSQPLAATSASDFQIWSLISGSLPPGLSLSLGGTIFGTATAVGPSNFTVQMMDGAQQYAIQALTLTVQ